MKDDGGPAFPIKDHFISQHGPGSVDAPGMTLRDYFAAKAMQAQIAHTGGRYTASDIAISSYAVADAMIEKKKTGETK